MLTFAAAFRSFLDRVPSDGFDTYDHHEVLARLHPIVRSDRMQLLRRAVLESLYDHTPLRTGHRPPYYAASSKGP